MSVFFPDYLNFLSRLRRRATLHRPPECHLFSSNLFLISRPLHAAATCEWLQSFGLWLDVACCAFCDPFNIFASIVATPSAAASAGRCGHTLAANTLLIADQSLCLPHSISHVDPLRLIFAQGLACTLQRRLTSTSLAPPARSLSRQKLSTVCRRLLSTVHSGQGLGVIRVL